MYWIARGVDRVLQSPDPTDVPTAALGIAEDVQHMRARVVGNVFEQRSPQVLGSGLRRATGKRRVRGLPEGREGRRLTVRIAREQVCGDGLRLDALAGQQPRGTRVKRLSLPRRDVVVDRRSGDGVHEMQRLARREDGGIRQRARQPEGLAGVDLGKAGRSGDARVGTQHRDRAGERRGVVSETSDPQQERRRHPLRNSPSDRRGVDLVRGRSIEAEIGEQLGEQKGIAARRIGERGTDVVGRVVAEAVTHHHGDALAAERPGP